MRFITDLLIPTSVIAVGTTPITGSWVDIGKTFGVPVMLLAYFLIRDWRRSKEDIKVTQKLATRLDAIVDQYSKLTSTIIIDNTKALTAVGETLRVFAKDRPCLLEK